MRRRVGWGGAAVGLFALLTVGACSAGSGSATGDSAGSGSAGSGPATSQLGTVGSATGGGAAAKDASPAAAGRVAAQPDAAGAPALLQAEIRTAQITVAVRGAGNVAARAGQASTIAVDAGGAVDADDRTSGPHASAVLQLRVPPARLGPTLDRLSALGAEKGRRLSTTDVSEKVADVGSRVQSARESIARLRTLYSSATKVSDVIAVESELSTREADLESLEAQQRTLARQTSMATITLTLQTAAAAAPAPHRHRSGFVGGLERGWDGFTATAAWLATALGTVLPFLALLIVVALAARVLWSRLAVHRASPRPTPNPAE